MSRAKKHWLWLFGAFPFLVAIRNLFGVTWSPTVSANLPIHASLETLVGSAALWLGGLLNLLSKDRPAESWLRWVAYALWVMGSMDLIHAVIDEPNLLVATRSLATFAAGLMFACLWLPRRPPVWLPWGVLAVMLAAILAIKYAPGVLPPFVAAGHFTLLPNALNLAGGLGFAAAALWFLRTRTAEHRMGATFCALLASSALSFPFSTLWTAGWWGWHLLRLLGGVAASAYFGTVYVRLVSQTREALQSRETFLDMAAHELRTPLVPLLMRVQITERELQKGEPVRLDEMQKITRGVQYLVELTNGLFAATPNGTIAHTFELTRVPIAPLVRGVIENIQDTSQTHEIRLEGGTTDAVVMGNTLYLRLVLINLLRNAIKYSPEGGMVTVSLSVAGSQVQIAVRDKGIGIPQGDQGRVFHKFFRGANYDRYSIAGLGLGLYISEDIVRKHGGTIAVTSAPREGTTFTVTLPTVNVISEAG